MFDDDSNLKDNGGQKKPSGKSFNNLPVYTMLAWAGIIAAAVLLLLMKQHITTPSVTLSQSEFLTKFESNQIAHAQINLGGQTSQLTPVTGIFYKTDKDGKVTKEEVAFVAPNVFLTQKMLDQLLVSDRIEAGAPNVMLMNLFWGVAPFL